MIHRTSDTPRLSRTARVAALCLLSSLTTAAPAALLNLADSPLYLLTAVDPNILLTFDDSGSMSWGYLPDRLADSPTNGGPPGGPLNDNARGCASDINAIYYDPTVTYVAGVDKDGNTLGDASFTGAWYNGYNLTAAGAHQGTIVNLATSFQATWSTNSTITATGTVASCGTGTTAGQAAYYYTYTTGCALAGGVDNDACYTRVQHNNPTAWTAAEQQNFANWYSYYRTRNQLAKSAVGRAFSRLGGNVRVAAHHLNNITATSPTRFTKTIGVMKAFSGTDRTDFFTRLYNSPASNSTPLREALKRSGDYFSDTNAAANSPYRDLPGTSGSPERSCRQNFNILLTDGYWNGTAGVSGNFDGNNYTLGDGITAYTPKAPYRDSTSSTLADNAFYYWAKDLRIGLTNNVPTRPANIGATTPYTPWSAAHWNAKNDPAHWQHLVNYTIGLGISGQLNFDGATGTTYDNLVAGVTAWPAAAADQPSAVDDLWHAAINSRGEYFSAQNPTQLVDALTTVLNSITADTGSSAAVAVNAGTISSNSSVYQAKFESGFWLGSLLSYPIQTSGTVSTTHDWDAGQKLAEQEFDTGRTIFTFKPSGNVGIPFVWPSNPASPSATEMDTTQSAWLNYNPVTATADVPSQGEARLDYLRGDGSNEGALGLGYRARSRICSYDAQQKPVYCAVPAAGATTGVLGDTINSAPLYVGRSPFSYTDNSYATYRTSTASRTPMVYVGANDGMLHGIEAATGVEKFAYVPSSVYRNLSRLTAANYAHRFFVDGDPIAGDVRIATNVTGSNPGGWTTILVSTLRKGGQGVFALDISDPSTFTQTPTNAANTVLWEFTDTNDRDLGYTYSQVQIVRMANDKWAAIFGNGYNNTDADGNASLTGNAVLYILYIEDGVDGWAAGDWVKIDTGVGITVTNTTPNGLATPTATDVDRDGKVDFIYGGDLRGNMWRFDVRSNNDSQWTMVANHKVVFTAKDSGGIAQPITARPTIGLHPASLAGYMVYFGTGKYMETTDATSAGSTTQTFYGVWDDINGLSGITPPSTRAGLLQQTVVGTPIINGSDYRIISDNAMVWRAGSPAPSPSYVGWYLDLPTLGERQVTNPVLRGSRAIFTTVIPSNDPCTNGGEGWLMELDIANGGRLDETPFDTNGDMIFDNNDKTSFGTGTVATGGTRFKTGIPSAPVILNGGTGGACLGGECKFISSSDGIINSVNENPDEGGNVRESWRQQR
jgi:type IV pilus assembly protein PilY1